MAVTYTRTKKLGQNGVFWQIQTTKQDEN